jgi:hypothetical protein
MTVLIDIILFLLFCVLATIFAVLTVTAIWQLIELFLDIVKGPRR